MHIQDDYFSLYGSNYNKMLVNSLKSFNELISQNIATLCEIYIYIFLRNNSCFIVYLMLRTVLKPV